MQRENLMENGKRLNGDILSLVISKSGKIVLIDEKISQMLGYDEGFQRSFFHKIVSSDSLGELIKIIDEVSSGQKRVSSIEIVGKDGTVYRMEIFALPELFRDETAVRCFILGIRETEKKDDSFNLFRTRLGSIIKSVGDLIFIFDKNGRIAFYSTSDHKKLYLPPDKFMRRKIDEIFPEHVSKPFLELFEKLKNGGSAEFEYWLDFDGDRRWFSAKLTSIIVNDKFEGVSAVVRDITENKKLNELLKIVNSVLSTIIRSSTLEELMDTVSKELENLKYPVCVIAVKTEEGFITTSKDLRRVRMSEINSRSHLFCVAETMESRKSLFRDGQDERCRDCIFDQGKGTKYRYIFPISTADTSYGGLIIFSFEKLADEEIEILEKMAKDLAIAIKAIRIDELEKYAYKQVEDNLIDILLVIDRIRNPLTVISYLAESGKEEVKSEIFDKIMDEVNRIIKIIETLEMRWYESEDLIRSIKRLIHR